MMFEGGKSGQFIVTAGGALDLGQRGLWRIVWAVRAGRRGPSQPSLKELEYRPA
jgi:hypothetical protein